MAGAIANPDDMMIIMHIACKYNACKKLEIMMVFITGYSSIYVLIVTFIIVVEVMMEKVRSTRMPSGDDS